MSENDSELEQLRQKTEMGDRASTPATGSGSEGGELVDSVVKELDSDASSQVSLRDDRIAALLRVLESESRLDDLGQQLHEAAGRDGEIDGADRSDVMRLAFRVALSEGAPEYWDVLQRGVVEHTKQQV